MRSVKDYSISADAAQGAMPARGGVRPNRRWRVLAPDRQRGKDRRLSFDNIGLRRNHDTIINPIDDLPRLAVGRNVSAILCVKQVDYCNCGMKRSAKRIAN